MSYHFTNKALTSHLTSGRSAGLAEPYQRLLTRLGEEVRRYEFKTADGRISVGTVGRDVSEAAGLVEWSAEILRFVCSCDVTTDQLRMDEQTEGRESPIEMLMGLFEPWREFSEVDDGPFVSLAKYPSLSIKAEPHATVGNLCAAVGLAVLDSLPLGTAVRWSGSQIRRLGIAWELALLARSSNFVEMTAYFERQARAA